MPDQMDENSLNGMNIVRLLERSQHQSSSMDEIKSKLDDIDNRLRSIENWQNRLIGGAIALSAVVGIGGLAVAIVGLLVMR